MKKVYIAGLLAVVAAIAGVAVRVVLFTSTQPTVQPTVPPVEKAETPSDVVMKYWNRIDACDEQGAYECWAVENSPFGIDPLKSMVQAYVGMVKAGARYTISVVGENVSDNTATVLADLTWQYPGTSTLEYDLIWKDGHWYIIREKTP